MTITAPETKADETSIMRLRRADRFTFRGEEYVLKNIRQSKAEIIRVRDKKIFLLGVAARVTTNWVSEYGILSEVLASQAPKFNVGDRVRIVTVPRTVKKNIAGTESIIIRVNQKTYSLANNWNVGFDSVEAV